VPSTRAGYSTAYLWEETWARDSVLDLVRQFIHEVEEEDDRGRKTGRRFLIFPRYQQLDAVRRLVAHAREHGAGQRYLVQHSAGSGKSFTIAWLAHRLATPHDAADRRVFDSIVVITDRRILDRQLQSTMRQFEQTLGVVENIDTTSRQLKQALESGKTIIVTTLQKFRVISKEIGELPGHRFAVIVDEAHSSQSGESTRSLKSVLAAGTLEDAEREEASAATPEEELESAILAEIEKRGPLGNLSTFAFTATPNGKTLELFGRRGAGGKFEPFHLYSMRQAIEEKFILDVLQSYTTYKAYWRLLKTVEDDPRYDKQKASYLLRSFVQLHEHASLREDRQDDKAITHAALKTIAAFLNTEGGDLLIGVADDGVIVGIEADRLDTDDKFMRHLAQAVRNGLGDRAGTCIDPRAQIVGGKTVCVVSCQRSPEPVFLKWKGMESAPEGDLYVRSGPGSVRLPPESAREYIRTRFRAAT
jgi:type I site-specific restriction-modification system R (restriction) subunit